MMKRHVLVKALPSTGRTRWMRRGKESRQGTAKPSSREIPPKGANSMGKQGFYSGAGKPWVGEAAATIPVLPQGPSSPHRSPKPYCSWKAQRKGMGR